MKELKDIACNTVLSEVQLEKIEHIILSQGRYTKEAIREELDWFCAGLVMSEYYFKTTPVETIAKHIQALMAAEILATVKQDKTIKIDLGTELEDEAIYLVDDYHYHALEIERRIEERYPNCRLQSYRTLRNALGLVYLRMYLVSQPLFSTNPIPPEETDLRKIADRTFLASSPEKTLQRYQMLVNESKGWESPLIDVSHDAKTKELRIMIITLRDSSHRFFSNISDVLNSHGLVSHRKYIEQLATGKTVFSVYLEDIQDEAVIQNLIEDIGLVYAIPDSPLFKLFRENSLNAQETVFGVSAWSFAHQFLSGYNEEYMKLSEVLKDTPELLGILRNLKTKLIKDTYHESRIWETLTEHYGYLKKAFRLFDKKFNPRHADHSIDGEMAALKKEILRKMPTDIDRHIFLAVLLFIEVTLKTNFYLREKTALSFMYDPSFLNTVDYSVTPFGIFHIVGAEFRGFHVRFRDIARGGIRIVRSSNIQTYLTNSDFIFDENYSLALTQQNKNKDLPEGGSKGTILLNWGFMDKAEVSFRKYIDGLLDLMLPDQKIIDYYGNQTILFLGPDEGTADLMEWASLRGRSRSYSFWKSFTTGKPLAMGGIPHDLYGMTTNSVHQFVLDTLRELRLKEQEITKVMTGGPDGDLGSNEILISKDRILAIIDGSGVLYDPEGIRREELNTLARERKTVAHFLRNSISPKGFLVTIKDQEVILPNGERLENGLEFRNSFHLHPLFRATLFVPCGGRPASVNINNWRTYISENGEPRFKVIVEGANLFLTQEARLRLEEKGVIIFKDASANKGGVTSSSLEVLASLALTDEEYDTLMCVKNNAIPEFRRNYIEEILGIIRENSSLEFAVIWKENAARKIPRTLLTDMISEKINRIKDAIYGSDLIENKDLLRKAVECCCPPSLIQQVGTDQILDRVPASYLKAIFASRLASRYVYKYGLDANEINFYEFLENFE
ncbi:MAG: NAD-glutamate dehydrogenase domain-containing protein [Candidatus Aminicenantales bacterium]